MKTSLPIDPNARHAYFPEAGPMCLGDVRPRARIIMYSCVSKSFSMAILTSGWRVEFDDEASSAYDRVQLMADAGHHSINLIHVGICPYHNGGWFEGGFSVLVTEQTVTTLHLWLRTEGDIASAERLELMFPEYFDGGVVGAFFMAAIEEHMALQ